MQDGCKSLHGFLDGIEWSMVTWTTFKNHLLEVGLTKNRETMALRTLKTIDLFYFITYEGLHE